MFNTVIYQHDLNTLRSGRMLNDEIINYYLQLLVLKVKSSYNTVFLFNTFFLLRA